MGQDIDIPDSPALGLAFIVIEFVITVEQAIDEGPQVHIQGIGHDSQFADAFLHGCGHEAPGHAEIFIRRIADGLPFQADEEIGPGPAVRQAVEDVKGRMLQNLRVLSGIGPDELDIPFGQLAQRRPPFIQADGDSVHAAIAIISNHTHRSLSIYQQTSSFCKISLLSLYIRRVAKIKNRGKFKIL